MILPFASAEHRRDNSIVTARNVTITIAEIVGANDANLYTYACARVRTCTYRHSADIQEGFNEFGPSIVLIDTKERFCVYERYLSIDITS